MITADSDAGRAVLRHSTAHVLAQAVLELWPGAHYAIGPSITDGFYYDFDLPGGATFSDDDLARIDDPDARHHGRGPAPSSARSIGRRGPGAVRRPALQARDHRGVSAHDAELSAEASADIAAGARCGEHLPQRATLRRPVPRSPRAVDGAARALRLAAGGRRLLARRRARARSCSASTARPGSRTRRWPSTCTAWRRPSERDHRAPRGRARPVLVPDRDRLGPGRVPSQGRHSSAC